MRIERFRPLRRTGSTTRRGSTAGPDGDVYAGGEAGQIYRVESGREHRSRSPPPAASCSGSASTATARSTPAISPAAPSCGSRPDGDGLDLLQRRARAADGAFRTTRSSTPPAISTSPTPAAGKSTTAVSSASAPAARPRCVGEGLEAFPNGMALHPDGARLYVVLSQPAGRGQSRARRRWQRSGPPQTGGRAAAPRPGRTRLRRREAISTSPATPRT